MHQLLGRAQIQLSAVQVVLAAGGLEEQKWTDLDVHEASRDLSRIGDQYGHQWSCPDC